MAALKGLAGIATMAVLLQCAFAASITVGGPNGGWDQTTDMKTWAAAQTFTAGDTLVFQYTPNHDVLEVSKADYDACRAGSPIASFNDGNTAIPLRAAGKRYFICGTPGHCAGGMKLQVDVSAASAPPPNSPTASPPTKSAPAPSPPKKSPPPSRSPSPAEPAKSPSPSSPPVPTSAEPSGSPSASKPASPSPTGSPPGASAAGGLKASTAAGFVCGLLVLLAF